MKGTRRDRVWRPWRLWRLAAAAALCACGGGAAPATPPSPSDLPAAPPSERVEDGWRPARAPLVTRWAADVHPDSSVLGEYPRPQLVRDEWRSLNGLWEFAPAKEGDSPPFGRTLRGRILVPYPGESALSGVGKHYERVWYRRTFRVPDGWAGRRVLLNFGAVDWQAAVYVNEKRVAVHSGGYDGFSADVTDALKGGAGAEQEIVVGVYDPTDDGEQPRGKQVKAPRSIWYTPITGIWQTVWLEPVPAARVHRLKMVPDLAAGALRLTVTVVGGQGGDVIEAAALGDSGRVVGQASGEPGEEIRVPVTRARRWSPVDPYLYGLSVVLRRGGGAADSVESYFGMRSVALVRDARGGRAVLLNGRPFFGVGPLDQGYWPDGLYTAPTDDALRSDLETTKALGFTMTRKHVKVEPERWYYWADRLGLAVWQDMPSGGNRTPGDRRQFEAELYAMIEQRGNHPAIVAWVPFNEGWGQYETPRVADLVKSLDPSRLVDAASGWRDENVGDLIDVHRYQGPQALPPSKERATAVGEFGGLGMVVRGHTWVPDSGWGYSGTFRDPDSLAARYELLMGRLWRDHMDYGTSAGVYTQLTDVEREVNGLLTYDRAVLKIDSARVVAANTGRTPLILPEYREFVRSATVAISSRGIVRYTTDGSAPTADSPRYRAPFVVRAADSVIVRARAFVSGEPFGGETVATFRRVDGRDPDTTVAVADSVLTRGVTYAYFQDTSLNVLTRIAGRRAGPDTIAALHTDTISALVFPTGHARERFVVRYGGWLRVPRDGVYALTALADDGARVWVGDRLVVDGVAYSPQVVENRGEVALKAGLHPLTVTYFQGTGDASLRLYVEGPGVPRRAIDGMLYRRVEGG